MLEPCGRKVLPLTTNRSWQELYAAAMLELDLASLKGRITLAQAVIRQAMKDSGSAREGTIEEMRANVCSSGEPADAAEGSARRIQTCRAGACFRRRS
jgi:hypothetical protein